jgi:putative phosphoesterase
MPLPTHLRLAVLADIHGNLPAFEAVLADLEGFAPLDGILVAGDVTGGPGQQAVLERLVELGALVIQGNNEKIIAQLVLGEAPQYVNSAKQFSLARWARDNLSPALLDFVCRLPAQAVWENHSQPEGDSRIRVVHGSPRDVGEPVYPARSPAHFAEMMGLVSEPLVVFGHTHTPWQAVVDGRMGMNPGAVCFPETGFTGAQYALLEWDGQQWRPTFREVAYDLERISRDYRGSSLWETGPLARVYLRSILSGVDYLPVLFGAAQRLAEEAGCADLPYYPDEVWEAAEQQFRADREFDWHG